MLFLMTFFAAAISFGYAGNYTVTEEAWMELEIKNVRGPGDDYRGIITIALFGEACPMTVMNFASITKGYKKAGYDLRYKGSVIHRVVRDFVIQAGDITNGDGTGGRSIFGELFDDEAFILSHRSAGFVGMANHGPDTNSSQFYITLIKARWLDATHVVFGKVIKQLNWTPRPFPGDIQLTWRYEFPNGTVLGLVKRVMTVCQQASTRYSYRHQWSTGVLLKIGEARVCIEEQETHFQISCRVNADEQGEEKLAVQYMWAHMAVFLHAAEQCLLNWNGMLYKVSLVPLGSQFFLGDILAVEHSWSLMSLLDHAKRDENIHFLDDNIERTLTVKTLIPFDVTQFHDVFGWIRYMLDTRYTVLSLMDDDDSVIGQNDNDSQEKVSDLWTPHLTDTTMLVSRSPSPCTPELSMPGSSLDNHRAPARVITKNLEIKWNLDPSSTDFETPKNSSVSLKSIVGSNSTPARPRMKKRMASTDRLKIVNQNITNKIRDEDEVNRIEEETEKQTMSDSTSTSHQGKPDKPKQIVPPMKQTIVPESQDTSQAKQDDGKGRMEDEGVKRKSRQARRSVDGLETYVAEFKRMQRRSTEGSPCIEGYLHGYHQMVCQTSQQRREAEKTLERIEELRVADKTMDDIQKTASRFVAVVVAKAVAEHIKQQYDDDKHSKKINPKQVDAARIAASAAVAAHSGQASDAGTAVIKAADNIKQALQEQEQEYRTIKSRLCSIL